MKLSHIRDIVAIAECGGLRPAARKLKVAQPAMSRSIRELEQELGVSLLERNAKGAVLTSFGERFVRRAMAVQNELRSARDELDQMRGMSVGHVCVALSTAAHIALMPSALKRFRVRYPDVSLRIVEALFPSVEGAVQDGSVDFYVGPLAEITPSSTFAVETLFHNTRVVFGRRNHPLSGAGSLRDLADAGWISTTVTQSGEAELEPIFREHGLPPPRIELMAPSALTMLLATASTDLLMMLPRQWLDYPATRQMVHAFDLRETLGGPPICVVHRARLPLTPAAEYFCDMIRRAALVHAGEPPQAHAD